MLYIIRHGKTDWNDRHKLQGRTDVPLNEEGRQMAEKAREEGLRAKYDTCTRVGEAGITGDDRSVILTDVDDRKPS